jgi:hypothetical protein
MLPAGSFEQARWLNLAGAVMALSLLIWEKLKNRDAPRFSEARKNVVRP